MNRVYHQVTDTTCTYLYMYIFSLTQMSAAASGCKIRVNCTTTVCRNCKSCVCKCVFCIITQKQRPAFTICCSHRISGPIRSFQRTLHQQNSASTNACNHCFQLHRSNSKTLLFHTTRLSKICLFLLSVCSQISGKYIWQKFSFLLTNN